MQLQNLHVPDLLKSTMEAGKARLQRDIVSTRDEEALDGHREIHEIQTLILVIPLSLPSIFRDSAPLKDKEVRVEGGWWEGGTGASSHRRHLDEKWLS